MEEGAGEYLTLVARLAATTDGSWRISVDGSRTAGVPLAPATLVMRLWRNPQTGLLRGSVQLLGSDEWAPIQSNAGLERLVRSWLFEGQG